MSFAQKFPIPNDNRPTLRMRSPIFSDTLAPLLDGHQLKRPVVITWGAACFCQFDMSFACNLFKVESEKLNKSARETLQPFPSRALVFTVPCSRGVKWDTAGWLHEDQLRSPPISPMDELVGLLVSTKGP